MYYLECQCRFTGMWDEVPGSTYTDLTTAIWAARVMRQQKRGVAVRVVDDQGNEWPV